MSNLLVRFDVSYSSFRLQVDLNTPAEGVTAIFGASGSGKTTLLRCLAGLERSPTGFVCLGEDVWQDESQQQFVSLSHRPIGYVFQEPRLFPHLNVRSNLVYGLTRISGQDRRVSFDHVIELLGLTALLNRYPHKLSGGEQQRVAIARAVLTSPKLLLMDEPLSSLDNARKREILPFIQQLGRELDIPIIYVSHAINEILQLASTLVLLKEGNVVAVGPIQDVFCRLNLRGVFDQTIVGAVLDTIVAGHEPEFDLTRVEFMGTSLYVPRQDVLRGAPLRLHILAKDVSIVTGIPHAQTSVLNVLKATVVEIGEAVSGQYSVDVKLNVGCPLLASITRKSLVHLGLRPGQQVYAHIKAVALSQDLSM